MGNLRHCAGFAPDAPHYGELTINLLIASSRLVNHDAFTAVAHVPLRHEVLIPCAKLFRVRGTGRGPFTPDVRMSDTEDRTDHSPNGIPHVVFSDEATADVEQVFIAGPVFLGVHAFQAGVGAEPVQAQQQARPQRGAIERLIGCGAAECEPYRVSRRL